MKLSSKTLPSAAFFVCVGVATFCIMITPACKNTDDGDDATVTATQEATEPETTEPSKEKDADSVTEQSDEDKIEAEEAAAENQE